MPGRPGFAGGLTGGVGTGVGDLVGCGVGLDGPTAGELWLVASQASHPPRSFTPGGDFTVTVFVSVPVVPGGTVPDSV